MRRELFGLTAAVTAGILVSGWNWIFPAVFAAGFWILRSLVPDDKRRFALLLLISFMTGALLMTTELLTFAYIDRPSEDRAVRTVCRVQSTEQLEEGKYRITCRISSAEDFAALKGERILLTYYRPLHSPQQLIGAEITFTAPIIVPRGASNPRCFDYGRYLRSRGIRFISSPAYFRVTADDPSVKERLFRHIMDERERFMEQLHCSDETRSVIRGILFGDTAAMPDELYDDFRNNGTAHVLAVSGLHIGVLYGIYRAVMKKRKSAAVTVVFLLFLAVYGTFTLWSVSVTRAILLVAFITAADLTERRYDLLTALSAAALILMIREPSVVYGAGFQMSFLAVASMAFLGPFLERRMPAAAAGVLSVQLGMIPYTAYVFNCFPALAILINIPVVWLLSAIVPAGMASLILCMATGTSSVFGTVLSDLTRMLIEGNHLLAHNGMFSINCVSPPAAVMVLLYGALFAGSSETVCVWIRRRNWKRLGAAGLCIILLASAAAWLDRSPFDRASFVMVDVGQGDCLHVKPDRRTDILIDGGGKIDRNVGKDVLRPYLLHNGVKNIDLALATHMHTDHYLGLKQLKDCYSVRRILTEGRAGDVIIAGHGSKRCRIEILWPLSRAPETEDENLFSLIFRVECGGITVLVTGDITAEGEQALVEKYGGTGKLKCDVLKVAHHGSRYSSSDPFLDETDPDIAVIGVGRNNYGHPSPEIIEKLEQRGIMVYRTDRDGAVGFIHRKGRIQVCRKRNPDIWASGSSSGTQAEVR